jgi:hypothetical protein
MNVHKAGWGLIALLGLAAPALAEPAHFWVSTSSVLPAGPVAPSVPGVNGELRFLHIWAQPATVSDGAWNAATNPFKTLQNFSLNLFADSSSVEFVDNSIKVYNPALSTTLRRHQFVHDSSQGLTSDATLPDQIVGIQGFSITSGGNFTGIGPTCHPNDPFCAPTPSGAPAWLVASVASRTIADTGDAAYRLQIGGNGMNHAGEGTAATSVVFGFDPGGEPVYNASANRGTTLTGDDADFSVQPVPTTAIQEMHWSGGSGQWSDPNWSIAGRAPSWTDNAFLDAGLGSNSVTVNGTQQANRTTINGGRLHISDGGSLASQVAVNEGGAISGNGWVGSNLTLRGDLAFSSTSPLRVAGTADIAGGELKLIDGYTQPVNTISAPFPVLEVFGGIQGTLSTTVDSQLAAGMFLHSIAPVGNQLVIQVRSVGNTGDYNTNGVVDAADYVVWRKTLNANVTPGSGADGNNSGVIDAGDYNVWRFNFGAVIGQAAGGSISVAAVPEPRAAVILCALLCTFLAAPRQLASAWKSKATHWTGVL